METHLRPLFATETVDKLPCDRVLPSDAPLASCHAPAILFLISKELGVPPQNIIDWDLNLIDAQPATTLGLYEEFVSSARMDNQISCHCGLEAFVDLHSSPEFLSSDGDINYFVMFDHEEIGSKSIQGALSNFLIEITKRIFDRAVDGRDSEEFYKAALRRSFLISADLAHAVNPNYTDKYQDLHLVHMHMVFFLYFILSNNRELY